MSSSGTRWWGEGATGKGGPDNQLAPAEGSSLVLGQTSLPRGGIFFFANSPLTSIQGFWGTGMMPDNLGCRVGVQERLLVKCQIGRVLLTPERSSRGSRMDVVLT